MMSACIDWLTKSVYLQESSIKKKQLEQIYSPLGFNISTMRPFLFQKVTISVVSVNQTSRDYVIQMDSTKFSFCQGEPGQEKFIVHGSTTEHGAILNTHNSVEKLPPDLNLEDCVQKFVSFYLNRPRTIIKEFKLLYDNSAPSSLHAPLYEFLKLKTIKIQKMDLILTNCFINEQMLNFMKKTNAPKICITDDNIVQNNEFLAVYCQERIITHPPPVGWWIVEQHVEFMLHHKLSVGSSYKIAIIHGANDFFHECYVAFQERGARTTYNTVRYTIDNELVSIASCVNIPTKFGTTVKIHEENGYYEAVIIPSEFPNRNHFRCMHSVPSLTVVYLVLSLGLTTFILLWNLL